MIDPKNRAFTALTPLTPKILEFDGLDYQAALIPAGGLVDLSDTSDTSDVSDVSDISDEPI